MEFGEDSGMDEEVVGRSAAAVQETGVRELRKSVRPHCHLEEFNTSTRHLQCTCNGSGRTATPLRPR